MKGTIVTCEGIIVNAREITAIYRNGRGVYGKVRRPKHFPIKVPFLIGYADTAEEALDHMHTIIETCGIPNYHAPRVTAV